MRLRIIFPLWPVTRREAARGFRECLSDQSAELRIPAPATFED
jgi:hypothetical protein